MIVLDTNVVSYIFNWDDEAEYYERQIRGHEAVISFQTLEESLFGAFNHGWRQRRTRELELHLQQYEVIFPTDRLVQICARLRAERRSSGREIQMADAWIAATALFLNCPLASHDKGFQGIPNLELIQAP